MALLHSASELMHNLKRADVVPRLKTQTHIKRPSCSDMFTGRLARHMVMRYIDVFYHRCDSWPYVSRLYIAVVHTISWVCWALNEYKAFNLPCNTVYVPSSLAQKSTLVNRFSLLEC